MLEGAKGPANGRYPELPRFCRLTDIQFAAGCGSAMKSKYDSQSSKATDDSGFCLTAIVQA
jgi:hypothetical protein